ncbi:MAG TPA: hypothetical protein PK539_04305 [Candidatus Paceibacterota bacterium]|nr:hypothetical protein [Candidatus Paceibacterota bacterium]
MNATASPQVLEGETGIVTGAKGYLLELEGLPSVHVNDVIANASGYRALVTAISEKGVEALLLEHERPRLGDRFVLRTRGIRLYRGEKLFGRVINALGDPIDGNGALPSADSALHLESIARGMHARAPMTAQFATGITAVDVLLPLAKGQRQMVIGPLSSGKREFLEGLFTHQKEAGTVCIYSFIGRPASYIEGMVPRLLKPEGNPHTIILATFSNEPAPMTYLAPSVATEIAEFFSESGRDVLLVFDDLGTHAKYVREIALLSGRIPGRESYPGDLFFQQARLLERGGYFNETAGGGSITILPVLETNIEDISNLVSTNLISATDGHLFFSPLLHAEGYFPAIEAQQSVTRVGRQTQSLLATQLSIMVRSLLAEYNRQRRYSQFGTQLSKETRDTITKGEIMHVFLQQNAAEAVSLPAQIVLLALVLTPLFHEKEVMFATRNRATLVTAIDTAQPLAYLKAMAAEGTVPLTSFLKKLEEALPYFESVWQP